MYGQPQYTRNCIEVTQQHSNANILIVDDGSQEPFSDKFDPIYKVDILRINRNSGFTNAVNQGILYAQKKDYDAVLLLNNDTEPCEKFLTHLESVMESSKDIGITGSVRIHTDKEEERLAICGSDLIRGFQYFSEDTLPSKPFDCNIIPFACVLLRMDMIREIGLLDKKYRNHCSDTEYCIRAKINKWRVVLVPNSKVIHYLSVTTIANNILVDDDQRKWIETLAGIPYAEVMQAMPLDGEAGTWGRINFEVYKK